MDPEEIKAKKKENDIALKTVASIIVFIFLIAACYFSFRFLRCFSSSNKIGYMPSYEQIHFVIYGSSEESVSGRFVLYDTSNREISEIERSWNSTELSIVFESAIFNKRKYVFPCKIIGGDDSKMSGTLLYPYYMENRQCLLVSKIYTQKQKKALYNLGTFALKSRMKMFSKFSSESVINLSECIPGKEYYILISQSGEINLLPVSE